MSPSFKELTGYSIAIELEVSISHVTHTCMKRDLINVRVQPI